MPSSLAASPDRGPRLGTDPDVELPHGRKTPSSTAGSKGLPLLTLSGRTPRDGSPQDGIDSGGEEPQHGRPGEQLALLSAIDHYHEHEGEHDDELDDELDGFATDGLTEAGDEQPRGQREDDFQSTKSVWYLILLTISIGGLQIAWSVELSNGSPYLLSLGLSKSLMALVWIAGPLTGTLVQPYVGMLSDNCRIPWGKRKPFMLGGAAATMLSLMILAWTKEMVSAVLYPFGADPDGRGVKNTTIVFAVVWVYILDFAINTVQAAIRAFILDCAPSHQQEAANAMASRIVGLGSIVGYLAGYMNLPEIMGWIGHTQFKDLCFIASVALGSTVVLSCLTIPERDPNMDGPPPKDKPGVGTFFVKIFKSIRRLPPQTKKVCTVQFCAWIGFFPMLFYTSSYIGEIYVEPFLEENPNMTPAELDRLYEDATRAGTFTLLVFAITSLATNLFLPFLIAPTYDRQPAAGEGPAARPSRLLDRLVIPGLTLRRAWMFSQVLFFVSMLFTVFARTVAVGTALIGLVGITWALTLWAPWAIISAEISRRDALARARRRQHRKAGPRPAAARDDSPSPSVDGFDDDHIVVNVAYALNAREEEPDDQAGVILGIHNMAIAAPQILATVGSSVLFRFFQKPRGTPGDHSIAIVLALGGVAVLASAWFIHLIEDDAALPAHAAGFAALPTEEEDVGALSPRHAAGGGSRRTSRRTSEEGLPRASMDRATLERNRSFGGAEY